MEIQDSTRPAGPVVVSPGRRTGGAHRLPAPPAALRGRAAVVAVAAGAAVSAGPVIAHHGSAAAGDEVVLLANGEPTPATTGAPFAQPRTAAPAPSTPVAVEADTSETTSTFATALQAGTEINAKREVAEEQARRPKVALPAQGAYTSNYAMRWGVFHGGIDLANAVGTPEYAATDGTVIDAGPAQGFGQWVRIMSDDGVMTVYGHMETILVTKGQRVVAGQQIAGMGSRGFSTGSHLHFEVWLNGGKDRVDPEQWLRQNGVVLPAFTG